VRFCPRCGQTLSPRGEDVAAAAAAAAPVRRDAAGWTAMHNRRGARWAGLVTAMLVLVGAGLAVAG
jgi:hypothetical protein